MSQQDAKSRTVYTTNLYTPPSWHRVSASCSNGRLRRLCYTAADTTVHEDECTNWKAYAQFVHPVSIATLKEAFDNEPDEIDVVVEACNHDFMMLPEYRECVSTWAHLTMDMFK